MRTRDQQQLFAELEGLTTVEEARRAIDRGWDDQTVVITLGLLRRLLEPWRRDDAS